LASKINAQEVIPSVEERLTKAEGDLKFLKKLKVNGWFQGQYQITDTIGAATVAGGNFPAKSDNRLMIRRGRIKFTYEEKFASYVLQLDAVEPSPTNPTTNFAVNIRDFYAKINMPFWTPLTFTGGMQNRPFGFEVAQSSSVRETPERSRFVQMLFPNERDLGAMLTIKAPGTSVLHGFNINAGLFNGSGIAKEFDSKKDFIGQVMFNKSTSNEKIQYSIGASYYNGGVLQGNKFVYSSLDKTNPASIKYVVDSSSSNL